MKKILIIEPDVLLAKTYRRAIEDAGFRVLLAADAQAAVHLLDENELNLVLMEVQLAGHNGVEFIYEMRSYPEWREIPIIINTFLALNDLPKSLIANKKLNILKVYSKSKVLLSELVSEVDSALAEV
jgi:CheY-like chemotaxis protein